MAGAWDNVVDEANRRRSSKKKSGLGGLLSNIGKFADKAGDVAVGAAEFAQSLTPGGLIRNAPELARQQAASYMRTFSGDNARRYLLPGGDSGWMAKVGAVGEDVLNIAPFVGALKGAKPGARQLARSIAEYRADPKYMYGTHVTRNPIAGSIIDVNLPGRGVNTGMAAGDAIAGNNYSWRLSPLGRETISNQKLRHMNDAQSSRWAAKIDNQSMFMDEGDAINSYLVRTPYRNIMFDENMASVVPNPSIRTSNPLEIVAKADLPEGIQPGSLEAWNWMAENAGQSTWDMIDRYVRQIALNNKRIRYAEGMYPRRGPR